MAFTFKKSERLCSKKSIEQLFAKGNYGFTQFPFRFTWMLIPGDSPAPVQVLITVSKRNFPKASQRNRVKRQIRELYRLSGRPLYAPVEKKNASCALMIAYIAKEKMAHQELTRIFRKSLLRLIQDIEKTDSGTVHPADQGL